jgi:hypothetical protein
MRLSTIVASILALASIAVFAGSAPHSAPKEPSLIYTSTKRYELSAWLTDGERYPDGAQIFRQRGTARSHLIGGFAATADPDVSFDARRVLFSGKQHRGDHWAIWELTLASGEVRRVTPKTDDDYLRPFYLPEERLVYARRYDHHLIIEAAALTGGESLQLTYGPGNFLPSDVLHDGRVLFEALYPSGRGSHAELYTVYPDGSGVESYRCDHKNSRQLGRELASGDIVFAEEHGLARFTSALAHEVTIPVPAGEYAGDVAEAPDGDWLIAWRQNATAHFTINRFKPGTRALRSILSEAGEDVVQPVFLQPRAVPKRFPSALHDWTVGNLLCLNAYTSKYAFREGSIASVRVYTRDHFGKAQLLGSAPVETDGSFYVQVPGDQPLQFELLDGSGNTLKREANWFWMRSGEQRVCVGCHAGPETAPENAEPAVLLKSTTPADLTGSAKAHEGGH